MTMNLDSNLLQVFLKVYEQGSLSKAARFLGLSQPGVSLALKRLRDHFDDPLFVRSPNGVGPTVFAQALFPSIKKAAESLQHALEFKADFVPSESTRIFNIALSDFGQLIFLPPLLEKIDIVAPHVKVDVVPITFETEYELSQGGLDLSLGFTHTAKDNFYQQLLTESHFVGLVSANHPYIGDSITLEEYTRARHVAIRKQTSGFYEATKCIADMGINRNFAAVLSNYTSVPTMLSLTNFFMTTPVRVADMLMKQGALKTVRLPFELPPIKLMQHWHARQDKDLGSRWLRNLISSLERDRQGSI